MATGQTNPPNIQREESDIPASDEMVCLGAFSLDRQLRECMKEIWYSKKLSDFTIIADGEKFKTHKFLLNAHVDYFSKSPELLSQSTATLDLKPYTLELVLTFLYLGQVMVSRKNLHDLTTAAEFLGIDLLKKQCRYALLADSEVTVGNCLAFWTAARDTGKKIPTEKAFQVALENFDELQHEAELTELPLDCIQEYLAHSGLKVDTEDERLSAAMTWVNADKSRMRHLLTLLELLPLKDMQVWHLKQVLHNPGVKKETDVCAYLEQVLAELTGKTPPQQGPETFPKKTPPPESGEYKANITQGKKPTHSAPCKPWLVVLNKREMWGLSLQKDIQSIYFGNDYSVESIGSDGNNLYVTNTTVQGYSAESTLWRYNKQEKSLQVASHADVSPQLSDWSTMCSMNKKLYIVVGGQNAAPSVLEYDPLHNDEKMTELGSLQTTYETWYQDTNPICLGIPKDECIVVGTAVKVHSDSNKCVPSFQHTLEFYSVAKQKTIRTLTLPRLSDYRLYSILHMTSQGKVILVAGDFTAVCDVDDFTEGRADKIMYSDKYIVPNTGCMVALSSDRQYVMLLSGQPKTYSPKHYYYRAPVHSILLNVGGGWETLQSNHPIVQENGGDNIIQHNIVELPVHYEPSLIK